MTTFEFYRFRFHFRALVRVCFPPGKSGNVIRGAFGLALREAAPPEEYARLFEPGKSSDRGPSGLADWPRPFVFRCSHLDGRDVHPGRAFFLDAHVFDLRSPAPDHFRAAFARMAEDGLGPTRGRAALERADPLDLLDATQGSAQPNVISLDPEDGATDRVRLHFVTPTELKTEGGIARRPEFPILFARLRDRISTLRALYGAGPLAIDFRGMGERAASVRLRSSRLEWEHIERRSSRTSQTHPLGGFTGEAEYEGQLAEFLPWLRAARWVGVGRHTVWGKGEVRVIERPGS